MAPTLGTRYGEDEGLWEMGKGISTSYLTDHFPQDTSVPVSLGGTCCILLGSSIPGKESRASRVTDGNSLPSPGCGLRPPLKSLIPGRCYLLGTKFYLPLPHTPLILPGGASGKNRPANAGEMQVQSLGQEDPLENGMATHSSILFF